MSTATFTIRTITCLFAGHQTSLICHVFIHCLGSFSLHDMLLNRHEFAFEGQNMKFTDNILLSCTLYWCAVPTLRSILRLVFLAPHDVAL